MSPCPLSNIRQCRTDGPLRMGNLLCHVHTNPVKYFPTISSTIEQMAFYTGPAGFATCTPATLNNSHQHSNIPYHRTDGLQCSDSLVRHLNTNCINNSQQQKGYVRTSSSTDPVAITTPTAFRQQSTPVMPNLFIVEHKYLATSDSTGHVAFTAITAVCAA